MRVARGGSTDRYQTVFESVVAQIGKSNCMPLVQIPSARSCRYVREVLSFVVVKKHFGCQRAVLRASGGQINVRIAVVVDITKIGEIGRASCREREEMQ